VGLWLTVARPHSMASYPRAAGLLCAEASYDLPTELSAAQARPSAPEPGA
jgi:hypothetical protein